MKARILPSKKEQKYIEKAAAMAAKKKLQEQQLGYSRRVFKVYCYIMNRHFGFGKKRLDIIKDLFFKTLSEHEGDVMFWNHLDRVVIGELKIDLPREKTDPNGKIVED